MAVAAATVGKWKSQRDFQACEASGFSTVVRITHGASRLSPSGTGLHSKCLDGILTGYILDGAIRAVALRDGEMYVGRRALEQKGVDWDG